MEPWHRPFTVSSKLIDRRMPPLADGRPVPVGFTTVSAVKKYLTSRPERVTVNTDAHVTEILTDAVDGSVNGVRYETTDTTGQRTVTDLSAQAVILATGGKQRDTADCSCIAYAMQEPFLTPLLLSCPLHVSTL